MHLLKDFVNDVYVSDPKIILEKKTGYQKLPAKI